MYIVQFAIRKKTGAPDSTENITGLAFDAFMIGADRTIAFLGGFTSFDEQDFFIGMLTDSVSVFSFIRHEYFRRILCNLMGRWIEDGDLPGDIRHIGGIVQDICFTNALRFFDVDGEE